ncbi:hypothetical protein ScPMuIL_006488 [Solemya velum]
MWIIHNNSSPSVNNSVIKSESVTSFTRARLLSSRLDPVIRKRSTSFLQPSEWERLYYFFERFKWIYFGNAIKFQLWIEPVGRWGLAEPVHFGIFVQIKIRTGLQSVCWRYALLSQTAADTRQHYQPTDSGRYHAVKTNRRDKGRYHAVKAG